MTVPSFLNKSQSVKLPTGGDFAPSGFIGPFTAAVLYSFYSDVDLIQEYKAMGEKLPMRSRRKMGPGYRWYFDNQAEATTVLQRTGNDQIKNPGQVWTFQAETSALLNLAAENREKFGDSVTYDVDILTLRSKKRHAFQLMALPSAVAAMAKLMGLDSPGFSMAELTSQDAIFTDQFRAEMIGDPDTGDYKSSTLWARRAELWKALGETDPTKYNPKGAGTKFDTESDKLSECLGIVALAWSGPAYLRLVQVPDPRVDATYGEEHKRLGVPCVYDIYPNVQAAKVEADAELARRKDKGGNGATESAAGGLALPEAWKGMQDEFVASVKETAKKPLKVAAKELEVTVEELSAWREKVTA